MRLRTWIVLTTMFALLAGTVASLAATRREDLATHRTALGATALPKGFIPAAARADRLGRWFVVMKAPSVSDRIARGSALRGSLERDAANRVVSSQEDAVRATREMGGTILFRYRLLVNAFSALLSTQAARELAQRPDVRSVEPVGVVRLLKDSAAKEDSISFIGAPAVWKRFGVEGQGMKLALVDTGIDYTHKDFGGPGTVAAYNNNDPRIIEPGTFPTKKVIGGYDFVGENYDVLDNDPTNDIPRPDFDPLDTDGHGSHTGGTCCGFGVPGSIPPGVAPRTKILAYRVWDVGNSTDDVLVAAYERAVDPNQDGDTRDKADVLSFSGGVDYGTLNSVEARAAQRVVDLGTVFAAAAGNSGNQPAGASGYILGTPAAARGVISVAASIVQFVAQTLSVDSPATSLSDNGIMVRQDWSGQFSNDITDQVIDAREFDSPADPAHPAPSDRMLCDTTPAGSFGGHIALVFKGPTGGGDCTGTEKVFRAQEMGAGAVILWNGFGGLPSGLSPGDFVDQIHIPAVMLSTNDSVTLAGVISPDAANGNFNTATVSVTLHANAAAIPGYGDSMTDFTSEGPARVTNDLKPDITAPGADIVSAGFGTGNGPALLSGTSMATPHVSGVAVLLRQLHPSWSPAKIKALMMDQATRAMKNNDLSSPVPAVDMGAGRVRVYQSATAVSLAWPGSLSFGLQQIARPQVLTKGFWVKNYDSAQHGYSVSGGVRYSDFDPAIATIRVSTNGSSFAASKSFSLQPGERRHVWVHLLVDPTVISGPEQEYGLYYFNPTTDGTITVHQTGGRADTLRVAWGMVPLAASRTTIAPDSLDLTSGPKTLTVANASPSAGVSYADSYLLGATDPLESFGEEDVTAIGARSFTGSTIDGTPEGAPTGTDGIAGLTWIDFLSNGDSPAEPVEFAVRTAGRHNVTETEEVDVLIDSGADGVFADPALQADYMLVKVPAPGGEVCLFDLSLASPFDSCAKSYFPDYSNYNSDLVGLPVDAQAIGLTTASPELSYSVTACTGRYSGDVPAQICDTAGGFDGTTYTSRLNAVDPALDISPLVCGGPWSTDACDASNPVTVGVGSAAAGDNPSILVFFPNNKPAASAAIVETTT